MTFSDIHNLWLIWSVPILFLICVWGMRRRFLLLQEFASAKGLGAIVPDVSAGKRWLKISLMLSVLLLMVVSLSGPQYGYHWKEIQRKGVDIIIALDCSKSMLAKDINPTRLDRAKREVFDLLGMLQGDRVGLVAFAGTAFLQCPLTLDYEAFYLFLNTLTPDYLPMGGTNLTAAVNTAMSGFKAEDASDKAIILITDGEDTGEGVVEAARAASDAGIKLFCIGVGGEDGVPIPSESSGYVKDREGNIILSKLDTATLKKMAAVSGGAYVRSVAGDMDLDAIYVQHIRGEMDATTLAQQKKKVLENRYQWFLALAVLALIVERCLPLSKTVGVILIFMMMTFPQVVLAGELKEILKQGATAYEAGEYDGARDAFISSQLLAPDRPEIYYNLGNTHYKLGDYDTALKNYEQALDTEAVDLRQKAHYNMGNSYVRKGQFDDAIEQYEAAIKLDSEDVQAKENLEFVKKLKEQQPSASSQENSNQEDSEKSEDKDGTQQPNDQKKDQNKGEDKNEPSKKDGSSEKQDNSASSEDRPSGASKEDESKNMGGQQKQETKESASEPMNKTDVSPEDQIQAEKMLNRLKDKPGRALIPMYEQQQVEKDW